MMSPGVLDVAVTGASGNLGQKVMAALGGYPRIRKLYGLDRTIPGARPMETARDRETEWIECDLLDESDRRWRDVFDKVDAVIHFAAVNPFPEATWAEAQESLNLTLSVLRACSQSKRLSRLVNASSNHVMGGYLQRSLAPGTLTTRLPVEVGTKWYAGTRPMDSTPYSAAKWAGECAIRRFCDERLSAVSIRVGWCQPGENNPKTLSMLGTPTISDRTQVLSEKDQAAEDWYRGMWLSNDDLLSVVYLSVVSSCESWPDSYVVVNGVSANSGSVWSLEEGKRYLGYYPQDNVHAVRNPGKSLS